MTNRLHVLLGLVIWLLFVEAWRSPPHDPRWVVMLLLFSPLVLMPLSNSVWNRIGHLRHRQIFELPCAAFLVPAFLFPPSWLSALAALPWLLFCLASALDVLAEFRFKPAPKIWQVCLESTRVFPAIGAVWLMANRLNWQLFGFDSLVVLLTAAHFHHAGFTLPLIAGLQGRRRPGFLTWLACALVLAGVPFVAVGITLTHIVSWPWLEPWSVAVLTAGALLVAIRQVTLAFNEALTHWQSILISLSGLALAVAMLLALGYGFRLIQPGFGLAMPLMWAIHGTLNVFGFGLLGIFSWRVLIAARRVP